MRSSPRQLRAGLLAAAVLAVAVGLLAQLSGVLRGAEQRTVAARFDIRGAHVPDDVALVLVDDATFDAGLHWPFPRSRHARVVDRLHAAGAREIVYDVQFTEKTEQREDNALFAAIQRAGGAVLATSESEHGRTDIFGGDDNLAAIGARAGAANLLDGIVDRFPYATDRLPSLAVAVARRSGRPWPPPSAFGADGAWIDFRGPPGTIPSASFGAVLRGDVDPAMFRGKVVVVGASAPSLGDVHATPASNGPMAGPEIQANAIWTALHGLPLRDARHAIDLALLVLLAAVIPALRLRLPVLVAALAAPVIAVVFLAGAQLAFGGGTVVGVAAPLLALATGTAAMLVVSHRSESAVRRRIARDNDVLEARVRERTAELRETQLEILQRLSRAAEWRDEDTGHHVARIGALSQRLALAAGLPEAEAELLGNAAVAHDIGKIATPDRILLKPAPLTPEERAEMQRHARIGASMLDGSRSPVMQLAEAIARTHHERWDGAGYPAGLRGEEIPLAGRICALCDVFDALVSERPYKAAWPVEHAVEELRAQAGRHFDPGLVEPFVAVAREVVPELYPHAARADAPAPAHTAAG